MKKIKVQEAIGRSLCHDITEMNGEFKGVAFKRGMFRVNPASLPVQKGRRDHHRQ